MAHSTRRDEADTFLRGPLVLLDLAIAGCPTGDRRSGGRVVARASWGKPEENEPAGGQGGRGPARGPSIASADPGSTIRADALTVPAAENRDAIGAAARQGARMRILYIFRNIR